MPIDHRMDLSPPPIMFHKVRQVKSGDRFIVIGAGFMESNHEPVVLYRPEDAGTVWVCPYEEFIDGRFIEIEAGE